MEQSLLVKPLKLRRLAAEPLDGEEQESVASFITHTLRGIKKQH
jgi:hypothetical protein